MNGKIDKDKIALVLSSDEALVFFEWLAHFNEKATNTCFEDQAEERILFDLESTLETLIPKTFSDDYDKILAKARDNVRDP